MSRKFITDREIKFINDVTHELIQKVVGEEVKYYAIMPEQSDVNDLYNEATRKVWAAPVEVNALVFWDNPNTRSTVMGQDSIYNLEVYFHLNELVDRNLSPKEGDFVEFGQHFFEIASVTQPQLTFGQINNKVMTKCTCVYSREGQFQAGARSSEDIDNSHPVEQVVHVNK